MCIGQMAQFGHNLCYSVVLKREELILQTGNHVTVSVHELVIHFILNKPTSKSIM